MVDLETVLAAENGEEESIQEMIDAGQWSLQGSMGRSMMAAIESGQAMLGPKPCRDYYGNVIPAWWMVQPGTKGSPEYAGRERPDAPSHEQQNELARAIGLEPVE